MSTVVPLALAGHVLRPYRPDDIPRLCALADDAAVADRLTDLFPRPYDVPAALRWLDRQRKLAPPRNLVIAGPAGLCGGVGIECSPVPDYAHDAELGYWLGRRHWGQGLATAAVAAFAPWVAEAHGLARLTARVFADNAASRRVLEKCGFTREGVLRRAARKGGRELDVLVYGLLLDG